MTASAVTLLVQLRKDNELDWDLTSSGTVNCFTIPLACGRRSRLFHHTQCIVGGNHFVCANTDSSQGIRTTDRRIHSSWPQIKTAETPRCRCGHPCPATWTGHPHPVAYPHMPENRSYKPDNSAGSRDL
jgi:hypothetical protein